MFGYCVDPRVTPTCVSWYHLLQVTVREASQCPTGLGLCGGQATRVEDQVSGVFHLRAGQQLRCELAVRPPHVVLELWAIT